jgi:hypothetical protein
MTEDERTLLLTVARILRASRREAMDGYSAEDVAALDEALNPYDPVRDHEPENTELGAEDLPDSDEIAAAHPQVSEGE